MHKSPHDNKTYQTFTLENGIDVLLTESKDITKSACSLVVNTGSFDDPIDRPGFAHFIEHLLFNGNEKFPTPNLLNDFVAQHGGQCNAWTSTEHSSYHFDIQSGYFFQALEYFAHMFVEPLFTEQAIAKEIAAIHAEYKLKLKDDSRRIQQVHKETANPLHPFTKFSVGNKHTLSDLPERPVIKELKQFWRNEYQAQYMTLAIVSPLPTKDLKASVDKLFNQIHSPTYSLERTQRQKNKQIFYDLYQKTQLGKFITIQPVKELHKLNITFAMPGINGWYKDKMVSFIAHIIGYEGPGSLFEYLRQKGLVNALSAGNGISGSNFKDFNISLELTEDGEAQLEFIIKEVFAYLNQLRNQTPSDYLYQEQKRLAMVSFEYQDEIKPLKLANSLALNLQHYPTEDILFGDYRMDGFNQQRWQQIFGYFKAENLRVTLVSKNTFADKKAHWYHTPYAVEDFSTEQIAELNSIFESENDYQFPKPNPYLTHNYVVEQADFEGQVPMLIDSDIGNQAWFKQDVSFRSPKGYIYVGFDLPNGVKTKQEQALMRLFCDLFIDAISEQHYQAEMAGLHYNLYAHHAGITLYTSGLSNNQEHLLITLINNLLSIKFSELRFKEIKRQLIKHWQNTDANKPINQLFALLNAKLMPNTGSSVELANILEDIDFNTFSRFQTTLFESIYTDVLIYGNWNQKQATEINQHIKQALETSIRVKELQRDVTNFSKQGLITFDKSVQHDDTAAVIYIQSKQPSQQLNNVEQAYFIIVSQILAPFSFNYLRSSKQLGYLAGSGYMPMCNIPGLAIYVQSHNFSNEELIDHLKQCLHLFALELEKMPEPEFESHKQAVIHQYNEVPSNMGQKSQQLWIAIGNKDKNFNQKKQIAAIIETLQLTDVIRWCNEHLVDSKLTGAALGSYTAEAS
ncbi:MAG: insulinase family protein [Gammaproteobacteria bacterium]|nr:insulinase family protein [Gammaproteobacteria bacterium]